jgi:hypothetical protein
VRVASFLLAIALTLATLAGGTRFLWCAPMGRALHACCCPTHPNERASLRMVCCEAREIAPLPSSDRDDPAVPIAPAVMAAPVAEIASAPVRFVEIALDHRPARDGPIYLTTLRLRS